jgi:hypothetical protein
MSGRIPETLFRKELLINMRKRNKRLWVHLNDEEYEKAINNFKKTGLSNEAVLRDLINGFAPKEKPDERFYEIMKDISGIANNVNQLARKANAFGSIHSKMLQAEAEKWGKLHTEIREMILLSEKM